MNRQQVRHEINQNNENNENKTKEIIKPNKDIIDLIITESIKKGDNCPIILEPLKIETSVITNCFHIFNRDALNTWLTDKDTCPCCNNKCFALN
jgi:SUMO ligase MMS21 Smc5/6 complex component